VVAGGDIARETDFQRCSAGSLQAAFGWTAGEGSPAVATATDRLVLPTELTGRLTAFGRALSPAECCGIGIGPAGEIAEFHAVPNVHEQPVTRYEVPAADQLRIYLRAEARGWGITFVFHTHPATEPYPSATDVALAAWPDAVYAIMGLAGDAPTLRAYRIVDEVVVELPVAAHNLSL